MRDTECDHLAPTKREIDTASLPIDQAVRSVPFTNPLAENARARTATARPRKSLGQNFLVDARVRARIVEAAELSPDDVVVEIGPGRGFLTRALATRVGRVVAVELDQLLSERLSDFYSDRSNVTVLTADAREVKLDSLVEPDTPYKVVANLPYYAASPIVRRFLEATHNPVLMVVMLQREVAREMTSQPGKMGLLSVATQLYGRPRIVATVPPRAFRPAPKVHSSVVRIDVYPEPAVAFESAERFFRLVRAGFSSPRKQIRNCLRRGLDMPIERTEDLLARAGIDTTRRAQTLSLPEWGKLYELFEAMSGPHS